MRKILAQKKKFPTLPTFSPSLIHKLSTYPREIPYMNQEKWRGSRKWDRGGLFPGSIYPKASFYLNYLIYLYARALRLRVCVRSCAGAPGR